jgi:hypothetical protein
MSLQSAFADASKSDGWSPASWAYHKGHAFRNFQTEIPSLEPLPLKGTRQLASFLAMDNGPRSESNALWDLLDEQVLEA